MVDYYNWFNFLYKQEGSYVIVEDRSHWGEDGRPPKEDYGLAISVSEWDSVDDVTTYVFMVEDADLRFYIEPTKEYHVRVFAAEKWTTAEYREDNLVWWENSYWYSDVNFNSEEPGLGDNWIEIVVGDDDRLDDIVYKTDGYLFSVNTSDKSNFRVIKRADHTFTVEWMGESEVHDYEVYDHNMTVIDKGSGNGNDFVFDKDGVYVVKYNIDGKYHYAEVYDFSDSEKCFLELMRDILCKCVTCEDCPGENYTRALNFANMYQMIRDMSYANQSVDSTVYRATYINTFGIIIEKLSEMVSNCLCDGE